MNDDGVILHLQGVYKSFGPTEVLRGVDLQIQAGQTTVVIGPSGCGKSVLLKHMIGLLKPDAGKVFFRQHEISHLDEKHLAPIRRRMGFLFQGAALFDSMTVEENICFPMVEHRVGTDASRKKRAAEVLSMVGLDGLQHRLPEELSGGQKKRVALARAISLNPQVIFYDEPTTGLDPIRANLINELILRLRTALGNTAVVVTHDLASARKVANRILMLHEGKFILDTTPEELDHVHNEVVARFIAGRAGPEELAELQAGRLASHAASGERYE
jgi:phospholipid/cholesterol/gamma-HCH transport system ATP-binding protein